MTSTLYLLSVKIGAKMVAWHGLEAYEAPFVGPNRDSFPFPASSLASGDLSAVFLI